MKPLLASVHVRLCGTGHCTTAALPTATLRPEFCREPTWWRAQGTLRLTAQGMRRRTRLPRCRPVHPKCLTSSRQAVPAGAVWPELPFLGTRWRRRAYSGLAQLGSVAANISYSRLLARIAPSHTDNREREARTEYRHASDTIRRLRPSPVPGGCKDDSRLGTIFRLAGRAEPPSPTRLTRRHGGQPYKTTMMPLLAPGLPLSLSKASIITFTAASSCSFFFLR